MYQYKIDGKKVVVAMDIPRDEWEKAADAVYAQSKDKYPVVGFRVGHAPRKVVEQQYGENVFFDETLNHFYEEYVGEILSQRPELEPVSSMSIQLDSISKDGVKLQISFEWIGDFEICNYKGAEIGMHFDDNKNLTVESEIKNLINENSTYESTQNPAKNGDKVLIDFVGKIDGVEFAGGSANDFSLQLGSHTFIDGFEDQLVGHKKDEVVDVVVKFPENYTEELKGKEATFAVTIKDVLEKHEPVFDDKFVSNATEYETVEEYRKATKEHIEVMKQNQQEAEFQANMTEYLTQNTKLEMPEILLTREVRYALSQIDKMAKQLKVSQAQILSFYGCTSLDEYVEHIKHRATRAFKIRHIMRKIIKDNNIRPDEEELKKATANLTNPDEILTVDNELTYKAAFRFLRGLSKLVDISDKD